MANYLFREPDVVFIHIPKNSGSSMRALWGHSHLEQIFGTIPSHWPDVPKFAVIRAPRARFLSAVRMFKFGTAETGDYYHTARIPDLTVTQALDLVEDPAVPFDRAIRETLPNLKHHLLAQTHPFQCLQRATHILRYETLTEDYKRFAAQVGLPPELPHVRKGNAPSGTIEMTQGEEERFARLFSDDLELLGYDMADQATGPVQQLPQSPGQIYDLWPPLFSSRPVKEENGHRALPARDVDLSEFSQTRLYGNPAGTWPGRKRNLVDHFKELRPEFGGASYLTFLTACCIVVARRASPAKTQDHALHLMFRALDEQPKVVLSELNLRWLTSIADTLADHGRTGEERAYGIAAALLANTVKLAESERRMLAPKTPWPPRKMFAGGGPLFDGVIAFGIERGDLMRNMFARVDSLAEQDQLGANLLKEVVARVQRENTVIHRLSGLSGQPKPPMIGEFRKRLITWLLRRL